MMIELLKRTHNLLEPSSVSYIPNQVRRDWWLRLHEQLVDEKKLSLAEAIVTWTEASSSREIG